MSMTVILLGGCAGLVNQEFVRTARRYRTIEIQAGTLSSPPPTLSPTTCAKPSTASTTILERTK
jgi:hypothetical protein